MFKKVLIANRGEIACRVIRTCRAMGIATVAVYSDADAQAQHVLQADAAVHLGPPPARASYLLGEKIIAAALRTGAQAIHPGYGFLSENAEFARACATAGLVFIGPPADAIAAMGSKSAAKRIMGKAGVPLVPGYHESNPSAEALQQAADDMGYPVLLKAVHGGGGKGMRVVWHSRDMPDAMQAARREAENAVGDGELLLEKYVTQPRHVEVQVFADQHGNAVYLAERDCSVQRRHQKVLEEAPAPGVSPELRQAMGEAAVRAAQAIHYVGAGTVEFLLDAAGRFYFIEMNTRLQVEHPVTEMITGLDLVSWQLRVAHGEPLPLRQDEVSIQGHAFEARVYAEDPDHDFLPATGTLHCLRPPPAGPHVRVDTGVAEGDEVSMYYDPMIAKLVVWDQDRTRALHRLAQALGNYHIDGVTTNIPFLRRLARHPAFAAGDFDTGFIEQHHADLLPEPPVPSREQAMTAAVIHALLLLQERHADRDPWRALTGWRLNEPAEQVVEVASEHDQTFVFSLQPQASFAGDAMTAFAIAERIGSTENAESVNGGEQTLTSHIVSGLLTEPGYARLTNDGHQQPLAYWSQAHAGARTLTLFVDGAPVRLVVQPANVRSAQTSNDHSLSAPINGTVVTILVTTGERVMAGAPLMVMEAMKMEHSVCAPTDGVIAQLYYQPGDTVRAGDTLLAFEPAEETEG